MGDTGYLLGRAEIESIVLGSAEIEAERLGVKIAAPAKDLLLRRALPSLDKDNEAGLLNERREEIERNTKLLITSLVEGVVGPEREITYSHLVAGLSAFCRRYPDLYPFCTT